MTYKTAAPNDCVSLLETSLISAAKQFGSTAFSTRNLTESVQGRAEDKRVAAFALIRREILRPTGDKRGGGKLFLHADFMPALDTP